MYLDQTKLTVLICYKPYSIWTGHLRSCIDTTTIYHQSFNINSLEDLACILNAHLFEMSTEQSKLKKRRIVLI